MNNDLNSINIGDSGIYLLIGQLNITKQFIENIIQKSQTEKNIIRYEMNKNNQLRNDDFEPLWKHIEMDWSDNPQTIIIENINLLSQVILNTLTKHLNKEYENIRFILTSENIASVNPSIKTKSIIFSFDNKNIYSHYEEISNMLTDKQMDTIEIDKFIEDLDIIPQDAIYIAEQILKKLSTSNDFAKIKIIKSIIKSGTLPETQKHFIRAIYSALHYS